MSRLPLHWWGLNSAGTPKYPCQDAHSHPKPKSCGICAFCSPPMHRHKGLTPEPPQRDPQPLLLPAQAAKPPPPAPLGCFVRLHVVHPARGLQKLQHPPELLQSTAGLLGGSVGMHTALRRGVHGETQRAGACAQHGAQHGAMHPAACCTTGCTLLCTHPRALHAPRCAMHKEMRAPRCALHQGLRTHRHALSEELHAHCTRECTPCSTQLYKQFPGALCSRNCRP